MRNTVNLEIPFLPSLFTKIFFTKMNLSPKSSSSSLNDATMSPHKSLQTFSLIPTIPFSLNLFHLPSKTTKDPQIAPVVQPVIPRVISHSNENDSMMHTATPDPIWKVTQREFVKSMTRLIEKTEQRVDEMCTIIENREQAYEICDVIEIMISTIARYSEKQKNKKL